MISIRFTDSDLVVDPYLRESLVADKISSAIGDSVHLLQVSCDSIVCWLDGEYKEFSTESWLIEWLGGLTRNGKYATLWSME
jgi:hypothetical protein